MIETWRSTVLVTSPKETVTVVWEGIMLSKWTKLHVFDRGFVRRAHSICVVCCGEMPCGTITSSGEHPTTETNAVEEWALLPPKLLG
ncbi:hypothetical protein TNCV_2749431 [Trichonephila clavipes]|nr:hypothetical protein TNCV_2749431 [Trichonephila clavipes]